MYNKIIYRGQIIVQDNYWTINSQIHTVLIVIQLRIQYHLFLFIEFRIFFFQTRKIAILFKILFIRVLILMVYCINCIMFIFQYLKFNNSYRIRDFEFTVLKLITLTALSLVSNIKCLIFSVLSSIFNIQCLYSSVSCQITSFNY